MNQFDLKKYLLSLTDEQQEAVKNLRKLIFLYNPTISEEISKGKWYKGLLVYKTTTGQHLYALGPLSRGYTTFHMMPYYASPILQKKHKLKLSKFLSGKSCIKFKKYSDIPQASIKDILKKGSAFISLFKK